MDSNPDVVTHTDYFNIVFLVLLAYFPDVSCSGESEMFPVLICSWLEAAKYGISGWKSRV